jgi:hypothetical protein
MKYATMLLKGIPCNFYVLNVFKIPYLTNDELMVQNAEKLAHIERDLLDASQKGLQNIIKKIKIDTNHTFKRISEFNFFINSIKKNVKDKKIDLIIMGTKGASGIKEIFMGSNTGDVIMKADCNVLAVPENAIFKVPEEIAFPTDFKVSYQKEDLNLLSKIAGSFDSNISIVHLKDEKKLSKEQELNKKSLKDIFNDKSFSFYTLTNTDFETAVNCFTQSRANIDMIAIVAKHYNFFQRLFFKPKVEELSFHTNIPLLVLHKTK